MKPKQNTLTDAELLILLNLVCEWNEHAVPTNPVVPGLDPEMTEVQKMEEEDLDDVPWACTFKRL